MIVASDWYSSSMHAEESWPGRIKHHLNHRNASHDERSAVRDPWPIQRFSRHFKPPAHPAADAAASDSGTRLVSAHPTRVMPHKDHDHHDHHPVTPAQDKLGSDRVSADVVSSASSVSPSDRASWPSSGPRPLVSIGTIQSGDTPGGTTLSEAKFFSSEELRPGRSEPDSPTPPEPLVVENGRQESVVPSSAGDVSGGQQQYRDGSSSAAVAINPGDYMRSIAAEARAWSARALASSAAARDDVDPVTMLLPDGAMGQRVGGSTGRGPLLRRLQTPAPGKGCNNNRRVRVPRDRRGNKN